MNRLVERVRRASAGEVQARGVERAWRAVEAGRVALRLERWHPPDLASRLSTAAASPEFVAARHAVSSGEWNAANAAFRSHFLHRTPRFPLDPSGRHELVPAIRNAYSDAAADAGRRARAILEGRYDLLGYRDVRFGTEPSLPDWHFDPIHGRQPAVRFWTRVPYLDPRFGDHKIIWELNRHQHWLMLGRAAWLNADAQCAEAFAGQLHNWMAANPPFVGINWASMLELGFRSVSWIWALHFFASFDGLDSTGWVTNLLLGLDRQLQHVSRHLSVYFSPNTHLLGEGLALYVAGRALPELRHATEWETVGRRILITEARTQVLPDGGHAERSMHYHRYALDFYVLALRVARATADPAGALFADVASRMATYCRSAADSRGCLPTIGDDDGGLLFPICGRSPDDVRDSLWIAAALLERPELAIGAAPEEMLWMGLPFKPQPTATVEPESRVFADAGYAVIRSARSHAIVDVGPHGFLNGGHAHADALSVVLAIDGHPLLVDPGTATYTMDPAMRDRFRSTAMHNTVVIDGRPQSIPDGPFHWRTRTDSRLVRWSPVSHEIARSRIANRDRIRATQDAAFDYVEAEHDGYAPLLHRRALVRTDRDMWIVCDHVLGDGQHRVESFWHLHPDWLPEGAGATFRHSEGALASIKSTAGSPAIWRGEPDGLGWFAPVYGQLLASTTIRFSTNGRAPLSLVTAIAAAPRAVSLSVEPVPLAVDEEVMEWQRTAVIGKWNGQAFVALFTTPLAADQHASRPLHRVPLGGAEFLTDARFALMWLKPSTRPVSVDLIDGRWAAWTGDGAFSFAAEDEAANLHLDLSDVGSSAESNVRP